MRATGRSLGKSHSTILAWERRVAEQVSQWSPSAPAVTDITLEGDEVYTRVGENLPPSDFAGGTIHFIERESRYWVDAHAGRKTNQLFEQSTTKVWRWAQPTTFIRWFTDGARRYGQALWTLARVRLKKGKVHADYPYRKVWRQGLEVAMKIKGSQGRRRVEWVRVEQPFTAISPRSEVHANRNEAQNSALRRRASTYRRRQNLYAKCVEGLQRVLEVQRLIHKGRTGD